MRRCLDQWKPVSICVFADTVSLKEYAKVLVSNHGKTSLRSCCISESPSQYSVSLVKTESIADDCKTNQNNSVCVCGGGEEGG